MKNFTPILHDLNLLNTHSTILGIDEVGRGCVAGPIFAAGVIVTKDNIHLLEDKVCDSKAMSEKNRTKTSGFIIENFEYFLAFKSAAQIDELGIQHCNTEIFNNIIEQYSPKENDLVLVDGTIKLNHQSQSLVKGETLSVAIAAASILAKVFRDNLMSKLDHEFPEYMFAKNKGYGTKQHLSKIVEIGPCLEHRVSFLSNYL